MTSGEARIAIFTAGDLTWLLPAWSAAIPELLKKYEITGIFLFPDKLGRKKGLEIPFWYFRVFGIWNFFLFILFAVRSRLSLLFGPIKSWEGLAQKYKVPLRRADTPNDGEVSSWVKENQADIILITFSHILKDEILKAPRMGVINKHATLLPCGRGVYPFFWAKLKGFPTGVTYHEVDAGIDTGKILFQAAYPVNPGEPISMLRFYMDVFHLFPSMIAAAVGRLLKREYVPEDPALVPCYFTFPAREDFLRFRRAGHKIACFSDLFYVPKLNPREMGL